MVSGLSRDEQEVLSALPSAVIAANAHGIILFANDLAAQLLERDPAEGLVGAPLTTLMPPRLVPRHLNGFNRYRRTGRSRLLGKRIRASARTGDGSEKPVDLRIRLFRRPDGSDLIVGALTAATAAPKDIDISIDRLQDTLLGRAYSLI